MVLLAIVITCPVVLEAQEGRGTGRLVGTVKDETGQPLKDVAITLKALDFNFQLQTVTDADGIWGIFGFGMGRFEITAMKDGFKPFQDVKQLSGINKNPTMDIILIKEVKAKEPEIDKASGEQIKKGNELYKEEKYAEALPFFQGFLKNNPKQFQIGINLGNCYLQLKQYEDAINAFKKVLEGFKNENPNLKGNEKAASIYANIGEAYSLMNNLEEAAKYYKESMALYPPRDAAVAYNVAEILFAGGMSDEAIEYYSLASSLKPDMAIYYSKLGYAYLNKGDFKLAIENFEKFIKMAPEDPQVPTIKSMVDDLKQQL